MNLKARSHYSIQAITGDSVAIVDRNDGACSVTNDAEEVVKDLIADYGRGRRFFYRDTAGDWAELKHDGYRFTGYAPLAHPDWLHFTFLHDPKLNPPHERNRRPAAAPR
jgi:hypothetical protein